MCTDLVTLAGRGITRAAFVTPPDGVEDGDLGRNALRGFAASQIDSRYTFNSKSQSSLVCNSVLRPLTSSIILISQTRRGTPAILIATTSAQQDLACPARPLHRALVRQRYKAN